MRYLLACLVVAAFASIAGYAGAQSGVVTAGVQGAYAFESFDRDAVWAGIGADPDEVNGSWGAGVWATYGINDNIDIVGDFMYYFGFSPDEDALDDYELSVWTVSGGLRYKFSTQAEWTPFVEGTVGWAKFETDSPAGGVFMIPDEDGVEDTEQSGLVARVAGGVMYAINESTSAFADVGYTFTFGDVEDWDFFDVRVGVGMGF